MPKDQRTMIRFLVPLLAAVASQHILAKEGARKAPNIVLIMADDMGYSDIGCYGGEVRTPNLDRLAAGGLRFTQFYNTARCCPTRASLMTGLYPHQAGVGWMMADNGYDGYRGDLNRRCVTIAEVLRSAGYGTYMAGKWHVTKAIRPEGPQDNWPLQRGFDRFYGTIHGAGSFYDPNTLTRDNTQIPPDSENFYYTDAISDNAVSFIAEHQERSAGKPLFLYVAYTAPHWPMHALPEDIERHKGRYDKGWDALRAERHERMIEMGIVKAEWGITDRDKGVPPWEEAADKPWHVRRMEVYAAMIDRMDQGIGRIVAELERVGRLNDTLIFFLADNGGCAEEYGSRGPVRPDPSKKVSLKPMSPGELQTAMQPKVTRDGRPVRTGKGVMPGPADTYIAYGKPWANASNTPFRLYKHWVHEGGIATPLIVHWPAVVDRRGELERQPGHLIDIMATCVEISGARYPATYCGRDILPMEGRSLAPAFAGRRIEREALYWEHEGNRAVRVGKWKLVAQGERGPWELYDLEKDRTERHDLAQAEPERVRKMAALWQAYAKRADVLPLNPRKRGRGAEKDFSKRTRFELKTGDDLARNRAPHVTGKAFRITADVRTPRPEGVILAQGGSSAGYALYLQEGKLRFATRHGGRLTVISSEAAVSPGEFSVALHLDRSGAVGIAIDGRAVASGTVPGPLNAMPIDGLQVGRDLDGAVGPYQAPFALDGSVRVTLTLGDAKSGTGKSRRGPPSRPAGRR